MTRAKSVPRLNLPQSLSGRFTGLIIGTYSIDLEFLERFLLPRLPRHLTNRVLLVDAMQLHHATDGTHRVKRLNRTYAAAPVYSAHAHHPKFVLLTGPEQGLLLVGSGNATLGGYTGPGEAFTQYEWSPDRVDDVTAFAAVREFLTTLNALHTIDDVAWRLITDQFTTADWMGADSSASPVVHNLAVSHLDQLQSRVGTDPVTEAVMYAPFHDHQAGAVAEILRRFKPDTATLLVQPRQTTLDVTATKRVSAAMGSRFAVVAIDAPEKYGRTFLHTKFVLLRTARLDYLLQGSANLSTVALCRAGASANIEVGSILSGPPGTFDDFLHAVTWTRLPEGLDSVIAAEKTSDTPPAANFGLVRNLTWLAPNLTGLLTLQVKAKDIDIHVDGKPIRIAHIALETRGASATAFTLTFAAAEADRIENTDRIEIRIRGHEPVETFPYRADDLIRLSSAGHRLDLLREAGNLDLDDKEILDLLHELDRVLIVDGRSLWRLANPDDEADDDTAEESESDADPIRYEDIDWDLIRSTNAYKSYVVRSSGLVSSLNDLQILLDSLVGRFRAEARRSVVTGDDTGEDDLGSEQESEDPDEADDRADGEHDDEGAHRHQSASARARRMWRSFVKRYVNGLRDPQFIEAVGPAIVLPSYIAFNHLCRRLRVLDLTDPDFLTSAQIALWGFMWGGEDGSGYLASLPPDERAVAITVLASHDDVANTLAAIDDAYWHVWAYEQDTRPLRDVARQFLVSDGWAATRDDLEAAAAAATGEVVDSPEVLIDELTELVTRTPMLEVDRELAAVVGLKSTDVYRPTPLASLGLPDDFDLSPQQAATLLATWQRLHPSRSEYRVTAGKKVAVVQGQSREGLFFDRATFDEEPLTLATAPSSPWVQRLTELVRLVAA